MLEKLLNQVEYKNTPKGIVVKINPQVQLPGVFTNELMAQNAARAYLIKSVNKKVQKQDKG